MTFALGCFFLSVTELIKRKSFSTYSLPLCLPLPQTFSANLCKSSGWVWSAKHHIGGSVCPGANASSLANLFTLTLSLFVSFSCWSL